MYEVNLEDPLCDRVAKLEQTVKSLCSLVHYLIKAPDFYKELVAAKPFNILDYLTIPDVTVNQIYEDARNNNERVDRERHLKAVGIHLHIGGNKFEPSPKF